MRSYNPLFSVHNRSRSKNPYWVVEIAFDRDNTDLVYFTSHAEARSPDGAPVIHGVVDSISGTSQRVYPIEGRSTIGDISVDLVDRGGWLTDLFRAKLLGEDKGLREKRVRVYMGFEGLAWNNYELVQTQIVSGRVQYDQGSYRLSCSDIQRSARKDIFLAVSTRLRETVSQNATTIPVLRTDRLNLVEHSHSYTDAPPYSAGTLSATNGSAALTGASTQWLNRALQGGRIVIDGQSYLVSAIGSDTSITLATPFTGSTGSSKNYVIYPKVGYIKLDDELICYPIGGVEPNELRFCRRGVLGSRPAEHQVGENVEDDRKPRIDDVMYLEMPIPKMTLALLTGDLWGQPGQRFPDGWHLDIDPQYIRTSDFLAVGDDIWDPDDDTVGRSLRFVAERQQDAKRFIESQINRAYGAYNPVYRDGALGLRRITPVLEHAPHVRVLDETLITGHSALIHDKAAVHNQFMIHWNYDPVREELTRSNFLPDAASIQRHGGAPVMEVELRGLHGVRHDQDTIIYVFDALRSRHAGPPLRLNIRAMPSMNDLEVGDIIRLRHPRIRDYNGQQAEVDRAFEIQSVSIDWMNGDVSFDLFGSSQEATPQELDGVGIDASPSGWYTSQGTNLQTLLGAGFEVVGDVGRIIADATLTGGNNMNATGSIFYYDGPLEVAAGVRLTIEQNVQIRVRGFCTVNGIIDGRGRGTPPSDGGSPGFLGSSIAGGMVWWAARAHPANLPQSHWEFLSWPGQVSAAARSGMPQSFNLRWSGGGLQGLPGNLRGTSGPRGGPVSWVAPFPELLPGPPPILAAGGAGGAGGAGLVVVCRGAGGAGTIDLSGGDAALGQVYQFPDDQVPGWYPEALHAAAGGGGAPGGLLFVIDDSGGLTLAPSSTLLEVRQGLSPQPSNATRVPQSGSYRTGAMHGVTRWYSYYLGEAVAQSDAGRDRASHFRVQALPDHATTPAPDVPSQADRGQAIHIDEHPNAPQTPNQNLVTLEVSVTPPADASNYAYSNIYYRRVGDAAFIPAGPASPEAIIVVTMDTTEYEIIARPVSIFYIESPDYVSTTHQVPLGTGGVVIDDPDNFIATSPTVGQESSGAGVTYGSAGIRGYDNAGNLKTWIDPTTGLIMAVDGYFEGELVAAEGEIGGWTITADGISQGGVKISSHHEYIQVGPDDDHFVRLSADGLLGFAGLHGVTFRIPTDGSRPMFSGGLIEETLFSLINAGAILTSDQVGVSPNGQGVLIHHAGIRAYSSDGQEKTFINAATGEIFAVDGHFSGEVTAAEITASEFIGGVVRNVAADNYIDLDAEGAETFLRVGAAVELLADGGFTLTGGRISTGTSGERIEINPVLAPNRILWRDSADAERIRIGVSADDGINYLAILNATEGGGSAIRAMANTTNVPAIYATSSSAGSPGAAAVLCSGFYGLRAISPGGAAAVWVDPGDFVNTVHMLLTPRGTGLPSSPQQGQLKFTGGNLWFASLSAFEKLNSSRFLQGDLGSIAMLHESNLNANNYLPGYQATDGSWRYSGMHTDGLGGALYMSSSDASTPPGNWRLFGRITKGGSRRGVGVFLRYA